MVQTRSYLVAAGIVVLIAGCFGVTEEPKQSVANDGDAGATGDGATAATSDATSAMVDGARPIDAATPTSLRCSPDAGMSKSPSGAACDWSRIVVVSRRVDGCAVAGTFCDDFYFNVLLADAAAVPAPFECGRAELGVANCSIRRDGGGNRYLSADDVEAACAVTQVFPEAVVTCQIYL